MANAMTRPNSLNMRPTTPPMNSTGMNTATSDSVMEMMVKLTSLAPLNAASIGFSPASMCRTMFSSMTIASSTTKPTASVSASSEMLSIEWPATYISANVPITEIGSATAGMKVARALRRKK